MNNVQRGTARQLDKKLRRAASDAYCSQVDQELDFAADLEHYSQTGVDRGGAQTGLLAAVIVSCFAVLIVIAVVLLVVALYR